MSQSHRRRTLLSTAPGTLLAAVLLTVALLRCGPDVVTAPASRGAPVVLITIDTVRADRLGAYGGGPSISPAFDRWADSGVLFEQASAAAPLTLPSHATLMTGLLPPQHGLRVNGRGRLPGAVVTLAETFRAAGYRTAAFLSSAVLARRHGLDRGFEVYDIDVEADGERTAAATVRRARAWLEQAGRQPFFLWVHLYDAHAPYRPPEPYRSLFRQQPYDGELAFLDEELGRLLDSLTIGVVPDGVGSGSTSPWQGTVCVVGDHGEGLGTHDEQQHGLLLYESTLRVPLVLAAPGLRSLRVDTPVSTAQVGATLVWLAGLETDAVAEPFDSRHRLWWPPAAGTARLPIAEEEVYAEALLGLSDYGWSPLYALRQGRWKIVKGQYVALFDLDTDPAEQFDLLAADARPRADGAGATGPGGDLAARVAHLSRALDRLASSEVVGDAGQLTASRAAETDRLRALGYLGGAPRPAETGRGADPRHRTTFHESVVAILADYRDGRFDAAGDRLDALLAGAPANPFLLDLAGSVEMGRGRPAKAVRRFQEALTTGGERLPLQGRLAEAFLAAGRPAESATTASAFVRASPGALEGRLVVVLCRALMALGRGDEARTVARRLEARLSATDPYRNHLRLVMQGETVALPAENPGATPVPW